MRFCTEVKCRHYNDLSAYNCNAGKNCIECIDCGSSVTGADGDFFGAKFDQGKPRFDLIDPHFEKEIAQVLEFGTKKYSADSWQKVQNALNRYIAALRRHLNAMQLGEYIDTDSGLPHHAHASTNMMFISYFTRLLMAEKKDVS